MCDICQHTPCISGCPNKKPDHAVCEECGREIYIGDEYVIDEEQSGMLLCDKCADSLIDEYQRRIDNLYYRDTMTKEVLEDL
ncbi:MAG: hypothetical protein J6S92_11895 [Oscillospiraceae bacterium]|nr:hypothetical protein [Oscillospiraceae bacterium]